MPATLARKEPAAIGKVGRTRAAPLFRFKKERAAFVRESIEAFAGLPD